MGSIGPVRTRLFMEADKRYDVDHADELITTFKQLKGAVPAAQNMDRKSAVKSASNGSSRITRRSASGLSTDALIYVN